jgi:hypothetical protein
MPIIPVTAGSINRRIMIQVGLGLKKKKKKKQDPISKITRARSMDQMVEHLPHKHKAKL